MSVKSKATGAAMLAAPEAGAAVKVAGVAKGAAASKRPAKGSAKSPRPSRNLNDLGSQEEREAELQRRREEAAAPKDANDPNNWGPNELRGYQAEQRRQAREAAGPAPSSPGAGLPTVVLPAAASTGSGFLLGVFVWALGLAYLRGGSTEVKQFLSAKFFNKVG